MLATKRVQGGVELRIRDDRAPRVCVDLTFRAERLKGGGQDGSVPDDFDFALYFGGEFSNGTHAPEFSLMYYAHAVA